MFYHLSICSCSMCSGKTVLLEAVVKHGSKVKHKCEVKTTSDCAYGS